MLSLVIVIAVEWFVIEMTSKLLQVSQINGMCSESEACQSIELRSISTQILPMRCNAMNFKKLPFNSCHEVKEIMV